MVASDGTGDNAQGEGSDEGSSIPAAGGSLVDSRDAIATAWAGASEALARWADAHLVNRRDVFGRYIALERRADPDRTAITDKSPLTLQVLARHFAGRSTGDLIGLHSTARDEAAGPGEVAACWSWWLAVDIDRHRESTDPGATLRAALALASLAEGLGFAALLLDSNGRGGFHLLIPFDAPAPTGKVHAFGKWLVRDWKALGLDEEPEVFPKQAAVPEGKYGNWLRLPGRHHSRDHFTRVWDGEGWLEGRAAIDRILSTGGGAASLIPAEALERPKPRPRPRREPKPEDVGSDAELAAMALEYLEPSMAYPDWIRVGMALTQLGRVGLELWDHWSSKSHKYEEGLCDRKWKTFSGSDVALGTLFFLAQARGFEFPKRPRNDLQVAGQADPVADRPEPDEGRPAVPLEDGRPHVLCGSESPEEGLKTWTPAALDALERANRRRLAVFQRNKKLARLSQSAQDDQPPVIETLGPDSLRGILDRVAHWGVVVNSKNGRVIKYGPPRLEIVRDILSLGTPDPEAFPPLDVIVKSPVFGPGGELVHEPGYHRPTRMYYAPTPDLQGLEIPRVPTPHDVASALDLIFGELLHDFPFRDQASRANALAVMLLPFVRPVIDGKTPNHHFTASTEGTGKGKCAAACAFPFLGRELAVNPQKESEAEWRKAITSFLLSGASHYFIDNIRNPQGWDGTVLDIESGVLAAAWTGGIWNDRIMNTQDEANVEIRAVFMSAGNNVAFSRELTRRLVTIELVPTSQDPSLRTGFRHDPLEQWTRENRVALTRACLVLCQNWFARGRKPGGATMGSYEGYARTMSGILEAAGVPGFLANRPKPGAGRDRDTLRWPPLVVAWHEAWGGMAVPAGKLYDLIFGTPDQGTTPGETGIPTLAVAFADIVGDGKALSRKQKFSHALGRQDGRVWGRFRIVKTAGKTSDGAVLYRLTDPDEVGEEQATLAFGEGPPGSSGGVSGVSGVSKSSSPCAGVRTRTREDLNLETPETPETPVIGEPIYPPGDDDVERGEL